MINDFIKNINLDIQHHFLILKKLIALLKNFKK